MNNRIASRLFGIILGLLLAMTPFAICAQDTSEDDSCCVSPEIKSLITIKVFGGVHSPGSFEVQRCVRLKAAIAFAGGITEYAEPIAWVRSNLDNISLITTYKLADLSFDKEKNNPYLRSGDEVYVSETSQDRVSRVDLGPQIYILGDVFRPRAISLKVTSTGVQQRITISLAVAIAGGSLRDANLRKVIVIRQMKDNKKVLIPVDLKLIGKMLAEDVVLQEDDIVCVPSKNEKECVFHSFLSSSSVPYIIR